MIVLAVFNSSSLIALAEWIYLDLAEWIYGIPRIVGAQLIWLCSLVICLATPNKACSHHCLAEAWSGCGNVFFFCYCKALDRGKGLNRLKPGQHWQEKQIGDRDVV